jgi:hypothetical protein
MGRFILFLMALAVVAVVGQASFGYFEKGRARLRRSETFQPLKWIAVGVFIWLLAALASMVSTEAGMMVFMVGVAVMLLAVTGYAFVALVGFLG